MSRTTFSLRVAVLCFAASLSAAAQLAPADDVAPLIAQAREQAEQNDTAAALKTLDAVIEKDPQNQEARQLRGDLYFKIGELDKAMADYAELRTERTEAMRTRTPPRPSADWLPIIADRFRAAEAALAKGALDDALAQYNAILAMDVPYASASTAVQNRGNVYRAKGDVARALQDYEQAIRLNPMNAGAYVNRGAILAQRGDHDAAILDYNEAIRFEPKMAEAFYNRGVSLGANERWDAALRDFDEALRLNPRSAGIHAARGEVFVMQGKPKNARREFEAAVRLEPKTPGAWLGLARLDQLAGRFAGAAEKLAKANKLNPNVPRVLNYSAWLHATAPMASIRNGKKAVEHALQACELTNWQNFGYVDTLAAAYAEQGEFEKATDFQWYALSLIPDDEANAHRAEAEERLALYQQRRKYREAKPREGKESDAPGKPGTPEAAPTPLISPPPSGRVGMSSPLLRPSGDRADFARALVRSCA